MVVLRGKGFTIRPYRKGDEETLQQNINNWKIYRYTLGIPYPYTKRIAKDTVKKFSKYYKQKPLEKLHLAIDIDNNVVGGIGLTIKGHKASIGYWLGEKYWGRGITTAAVKLLTAYAFKRFKLRRIYAKVVPRNKASQKVLLKAGYIYEGHLHRDDMKKGKPMDSYVYARFK